LLGARKPWHVRIFGYVGAMPLVTGVRNIETDFVQMSRPYQAPLGKRRPQPPRFSALFE
jgi:hypothetical protein